MNRTLLLVVAIAGCSDDVDLAGTYRVDADVESQPCGVDQPVAVSFAALVFTKSDLFGAELYSYKLCTDAAATECMAVDVFGTAFSEPIDRGWRGVVTATSGVAPSCTLSYTEQTAVLDGPALVIESHRYAGVVETAELCTTDEASRRNTSMSCDRHERIDATKL